MEDKKLYLQGKLDELGVGYEEGDSERSLGLKYREAKKGDGPQEVKEETGEMVSVPKSMLEQMQNDINALKHGTQTSQPKRITNHTARVKVLEDKWPVLSLGKTWVTKKGKEDEQTHCHVNYIKNFVNEKDPKNFEKDQKDYEMLEFMNEVMSYKVQIIKQKMIDKSINLGLVEMSNPDPVKMGDTGKDFASGMKENIVKIQSWISDVEFLDGPLKGRRMSIDNDYLNM